MKDFEATVFTTLRRILANQVVIMKGLSTVGVMSTVDRNKLAVLAHDNSEFIKNSL